MEKNRRKVYVCPIIDTEQRRDPFRCRHFTTVKHIDNANKVTTKEIHPFESNSVATRDHWLVDSVKIGY